MPVGHAGNPIAGLDAKALEHFMNARPAEKLSIAVAQLNSTVGDIAGNVGKVRAARASRGCAGRRPRRLPRTVHRRLSARRPGAQAGISGRLPRGHRNARARNVRRRSGACWSARPGSMPASCTTPWRCSKAAQSPRCATRSTCRTTACSTRSACSRRDRCRAR